MTIHLAEVLWASGDQNGARKLLREVRSQEPGNELAEVDHRPPAHRAVAMARHRRSRAGPRGARLGDPALAGRAGRGRSGGLRHGAARRLPTASTRAASRPSRPRRQARDRLRTVQRRSARRPPDDRPRTPARHDGRAHRSRPGWRTRERPRRAGSAGPDADALTEQIARLAAAGQRNARLDRRPTRARADRRGSNATATGPVLIEQDGWTVRLAETFEARVVPA